MSLHSHLGCQVEGFALVLPRLFTSLSGQSPRFYNVAMIWREAHGAAKPGADINLNRNLPSAPARGSVTLRGWAATTARRSRRDEALILAPIHAETL
jgi:hypothetical protein